MTRRRLPDRRTLLALLLVGLLVVAAGCSSGGGGDGDATATEMDTSMAGENATATPSPTATPTVTPTPTQTRTTTERSASGNASGDVLDGARLQRRTEERLQRTGSFTAMFNLTVSEDRQLLYFVGSAKIDNVNDRGISKLDSKFPEETTTTTYTAGGATYEREVTENRQSGETETEYRYAEAPYDQSGLDPVDTNGSVDGYEDYIEAAVWERTGTTTFDGVQVTRYDVVRVSDRTRLPGLFRSEEREIRDISGTALVTDDGVVRSFEMRYTYENDQERLTTFYISQDLVDFGETTVPEPDWLEEARNSGS